ncbi:GPI ethanolamine phosphate transferase 2 [Aaosphaeria arxii CBS 175.79]|uniref:GPI ethanolamine phosphate transferase 2 n=1 Tax=Aaosphaeria arxii CBS 175.79 TaxID=1450172 RepID=A0A6A5X7G1_9PLEO|nr:GPI ethanolamine phosphate transferase 2 [Aaosphaeria arxii CBS 175.79]KAF2008846.1 GPI ethanolamine phosphate transferase 2 [Aaosphaeria arxii CBS 175.79]
MAPQSLHLTLANLLIPVAILTFAAGFFPYKPFMPGLATFEELRWDDKWDWQRRGTPERKFDRLVFMVVDALRSDFVYGNGSGMEFTQSLIRDGAALPFTAHATSPTITMPRVKAITTGSIPSFLDVILNFAESDTTSTLAAQDTWLAQLRAQDGGKGRLVMYGDDTWLKLFPGFFERQDGTSSFFVSDFTEVDNNVTRHVPGELLNTDWNAMIMHYLGLDHIGHKTGPLGPNMIPKQVEMDSIVRDIYTAIENEEHLENTLFVLAGDHGMNEGGNHGGSAPGETSPALVFMSPKLKKITEFTDRTSPAEPKGEFEYYKKVEQSDIAPTLAGLLGFPVPRNNLGVFIEEFLFLWDDASDRIQLLLRNAEQVKKIVEATYPNLYFGYDRKDFKTDCGQSLSDGEKLACKWSGVVDIMGTFATIHPRLRISQLYWFLRAAQETMSTTASNYDVSKLVLGTSIAFAAFSLAFFSLNRTRPFSFTGIFFTLTLLLYGVLMFASSYVEEEQNFWYWMTSAWFFYLFMQASREAWQSWFIFHPAIVLLFLHRITRRWNQTGQKFAGAPDIVHSSLFRGSSSVVLWSLIGACYMDITMRLARHVARSVAGKDDPPGKDGKVEETNEGERLMGMMAVFPLGATAFVFKLAFTVNDAPELTRGIAHGMLYWAASLELVGLARMVFGGIALVTGWMVLYEWRASRARMSSEQGNGNLAVSLFDLFTLFLITQTKAENIPLYLIFRMQTFLLSFLDLSPTAISLTSLLLGQTTFFALGNSNAISSIDLSNSYNGVSGYNVLAVGALLFASNWAGPIYWSLVGVLLLGSHGRKQRHIATGELDARDWVAVEREHLIKLAEREKEGAERRQDPGAWRQHVGLLTLFISGATVAVMLACTVLRQHLFIWTVFSPKYLFAMAWGVGHHLGVDVLLGGCLWWLGTW